jgi:RNA polymerase sigma-70 factor, ECF subfamily
VDNAPAHPPGPDEFVTFMHAYQDMVFSIAARLCGNDAQAEDISQEVFLKAYEQFGQLRTSPAAGGWLKTVATRMTLNHLSRYRRRWRFFSELASSDAEDETPDFEIAAPDSTAGEIDLAEQRALIEQALKELPEHQRVPLVLYHFQDLSYEEIATLLRISLPKLKTDIRRGRAALARQLARRGIAPAQGG